MTPLNVFISYRREDTAGYAGRIYDRLNAKFPNRVFMDVTRLDPGVDFVDEIQKAVGGCRVLIVLIGKNWAVSSDGKPRLQDPNDFVRLEVGHALERKIRVIPILVGGASIPAAESLPPDIALLLRRQVLKLDDSAFDYNVAQLLEVLEKDLGPAVRSNDYQGSHASREGVSQQEPRTVYVPAPTAKKSRWWLWVGVGAVGVFVVLGTLGAIIGALMEPIDTQATLAVLNSMQNAAQSGNTAGGTGTTPSPLAGAVPENTTASSDAPFFEPVGRWRIALEQTGAVSLVMNLNADGTFGVITEGEGFSIPASGGGWQYDPSLRVLTLTGINNLGAFFQTIFQNMQKAEDHYRAFVPGLGNVVMRKE